MPDERLAAALKSHMAGDLPLAEAQYLAILEDVPEEPEALHYLGILLHQKEGSDRALEMVCRSIVLAPSRADWHNDLGNMLFEKGFLQQAAEAFMNAVELDPQDANFWNNLGSALERLQQQGDAEAAYRKAVELDQAFGPALNNLGNLLAAQGREVEAAHFYCCAYVLDPTEDKPKSMLGIAYYKLGMIDKAAGIYRQWMREEPENPVPRHLYASCSGLDVPDRAADDYIEKTFDDFSANFDSKMAQLSYRGHELIAEALSRAALPEGRLVGLDAGCGTGLCGPLVRPYVVRLAGVDLSSGMLETARQRNVYDELARMELTDYLNRHRSAFDLIVSSDTLNYFGDLGPLFRAMKKAMRSRGLLIFTVEEAEDAFRINPSGRYSHGRAYLERELMENGFEVLALESGVLRYEFGCAVDCLVVTASA